LVSLAEIAAQHGLDDRVERHIDEPLVHAEHILNHMAETLGLLVSVEVVPPHTFEPDRKRDLHPAQLLSRQKFW